MSCVQDRAPSSRSARSRDAFACAVPATGFLMTHPLRETVYPLTAFAHVVGELRPEAFLRHEHITPNHSRLELQIAAAVNRRRICRVRPRTHPEYRGPKTIQSP